MILGAPGEADESDMNETEKREGILRDLRAHVAYLLFHTAGARDRFRRRIAGWCKRLVDADRPGGMAVDTGVATRFGSVGSPAAIAALMKRGPQDLDEAYVLFGALHDSGQDVALVGVASPPEWDTGAQSISGEHDPRILDWVAHAEWHSVIDSLNMLTLEAVQRLPAWLEKVRDDCKKAAAAEPSENGGLTLHEVEHEPPPEGVGQVIFWQVWRWPLWLRLPVILIIAVAVIAFTIWASLPDATKQRLIDWIWKTL